MRYWLDARRTRTSLAALAGAAALAGSPHAAFAQRSAPPEVERPNRSCSQIAQMCMQRQGAQNCEGMRQECMRTGTWHGAQEITRGLQRR